MSEIADIIEAQIEKFDALRETFLDESVRLFLLSKIEFQDSGYKILQELTGGWYFYFSEYHNFFKLKYATLEHAEFKNIARLVSHIAFGDVIYKIPPENRIVIEPQGPKQFFQFFMVQANPLETFASNRRASGYFQFSSNDLGTTPDGTNQGFNIGGFNFNFREVPQSATDIGIGATLIDTLANCDAFLNSFPGSFDQAFLFDAATDGANRLFLTYQLTGEIGNRIPLTVFETSAITRSGATLIGGL